jgi:hypothetical protein
MAYSWRLEDASGAVVEQPGDVVSFSSQSDAESWLGEVWRELVEVGAVQVSLVDDGRLVYGPMSLLSE